MKTEIQKRILFEKIRKFIKQDKDFNILRNKTIKDILYDESKKPKRENKLENYIDSLISNKAYHYKNKGFMKDFINSFYPTSFLPFFKRYNRNINLKLPLTIKDVIEIKKAIDVYFERTEDDKLFKIAPNEFLYIVYYLTIKFDVYGKNIFYLDKNFYKLLQNMEIPDIKLDETFFPHNVFLVSFEDLEGYENFSIKEIFLEISPIYQSKEEIENIINKIKKSKNFPSEESKLRSIRYFNDMMNSSYNLKISFIIANGESRFVIIQAHTHIGNKSIEMVMKELTYAVLNDTIVEGNIFFQSLYEKKDWFDEFTKDFEDKLLVLFQLLVYLRFVGTDKQIVNTTPKKLLEKKRFYEETGRKKEIQKIEKKLKEYSIIHIVGKNEGLYYTEELKKAGKSKRPHWRRGHWRILKHPRFKKAKTFVRPALIGKSKLEKEDIKGHIYKN